MIAGERYEVAIHDAQWLAMELTEESARRQRQVDDRRASPR
jgi:hypothetical protein